MPQILRMPRRNRKIPSSSRAPSRAGFTFTEILVAACIAAAVITVSVLIYQSLTAGKTRGTSYGSVTIGAEALSNFFNSSGDSLDVYWAPSYGRAAQADLLRSKLLDDVNHANAVFCLGRNGLNNTRPATIPVPQGFEGRSVDTPEAFRQLLASSEPNSANTFVAYRGASPATNASLFILQPSAGETELSVRAVYDIDLTDAIEPEGTYASVKRYEAGTLTDYYDIFFPRLPVATVPFQPLLVSFERRARASLSEGDEIDRFKRAANRPFYFVWWPDPAARALETTPNGESYPASDPRAAYASMGGRTPYFFVIPMFPAL